MKKTKRRVKVYYSGYYVCSTKCKVVVSKTEKGQKAVDRRALQFERARFFRWIGRQLPMRPLIVRKNFIICPIDFLRDPKWVKLEFVK